MADDMNWEQDMRRDADQDRRRERDRGRTGPTGSTMSVEEALRTLTDTIQRLGNKKITEQNCFDVHGIDALKTLVFATRERGFRNEKHFVEASQGLDAGMQIFSKRVDAAYKATRAVLGIKPDKGDDDEEGEGDKQAGEGSQGGAQGGEAGGDEQSGAGAGAKGGKGRRRAGAGTPEATLMPEGGTKAKIRDETFEHDAAFYRTSRLIDENSPQGLLANHLPVLPVPGMPGCHATCFMPDTKLLLLMAEASYGNAAAPDVQVDISGLAAFAPLAAAAAAAPPPSAAAAAAICPAIDQLYAMLQPPPAPMDVAAILRAALDACHRQAQPPLQQQQDTASAAAAAPAGSQAQGGGDAMDVDSGLGGGAAAAGAGGGPAASDSFYTAADASAAAGPSYSFGGNGDAAGDAVTGGYQGSPSGGVYDGGAHNGGGGGDDLGNDDDDDELEFEAARSDLGRSASVGASGGRTATQQPSAGGGGGSDDESCLLSMLSGLGGASSSMGTAGAAPWQAGRWKRGAGRKVAAAAGRRPRAARPQLDESAIDLDAPHQPPPLVDPSTFCYKTARPDVRRKLLLPRASALAPAIGPAPAAGDGDSSSASAAAAAALLGGLFSRAPCLAPHGGNVWSAPGVALGGAAALEAGGGGGSVLVRDVWTAVLLAERHAARQRRREAAAARAGGATPRPSGATWAGGDGGAGGAEGWGGSAVGGSPGGGVNGFGADADSYDHVGGGGGGVSDGDDDDDGYDGIGGGGDADAGNMGGTGGGGPTLEELLKPPRRVARLAVKFDRSAGVADVASLKTGLHASLRHMAARTHHHRRQSAPSPGPLTFQDVLDQLSVASAAKHRAAQQQQQARKMGGAAAHPLAGVSPHLAFICLLHLANENGLALGNGGNLDALHISGLTGLAAA